MSDMARRIEAEERWAVHFSGIVQGVGFRPLLSVWARKFGLTGFVYNDGAGVYAEVQGEGAYLQQWLHKIQDHLPPLAYINQESHTSIACVEGEMDFVISPPPKGVEVHTFISADTAPCPACLEEMRSNPRRYQYPFINCTHCGPRYTLIESLPYDRSRTSMADFPMCPSCQAEYEDPQGRRYSAEPNACRVCGPTYRLLDKDGRDLACDDVLAEARYQIERGAIVALKGIGGYHLVCDGHNEEAVARLRRLKGRPRKPLALMVDSLDTGRGYVHISDAEEALLTHRSRPIVVLNRKDEDGKPSLAASLAPGQNRLGLMLPYAPIHYALLPKGAIWVMTSANQSGCPVIFDDQEALASLASIVDYFLVHNRHIVAPVDDSVAMTLGRRTLLVRRSRGFVPEPILISSLADRPTYLAMGSDLKNAFALNVGNQVVMGPHMGDLENSSTYTNLEWTLEHYATLFNLHPKALVIDKHPAYFSSSLGRRLSEEKGLPLIEVQHHHAHIGALMAEYNLQGTVLGVCFDGTGYGDDGHMWGGEFLLCQKGQYERVAHLAYAPLPGGQKAVEEPWRQALWYLRQHYGQDLPAPYQAWLTTLPAGWNLLDQALESSMPFPKSCGAGRLFDAVGSLLGLGNRHAYDGQVAIELEQMAQGQGGIDLGHTYANGVLSMQPTVYALMDLLSQGQSPRFLAASFHHSLAMAILDVVQRLRESHSIDYIALTGGVFQNLQLLRVLEDHWQGKPFLLNQQIGRAHV